MGGGYIGRAGGRGQSISNTSGGISPRIWFGSRRALSQEAYFAMQYAAYAVAYADRLGVGLHLDEEGRENYEWGSTVAYSVLGIGATAAMAAGSIASGQFWAAGLALAAIPLQLDQMSKNLAQIEQKHRIRRYYTERQRIIAAGFHR